MNRGNVFYIGVYRCNLFDFLIPFIHYRKLHMITTDVSIEAERFQSLEIPRIKHALLNMVSISLSQRLIFLTYLFHRRRWAPQTSTRQLSGNVTLIFRFSTGLRFSTTSRLAIYPIFPQRSHSLQKKFSLRIASKTKVD